MNFAEDINQLHSRRSELYQQGFIAEAIPLQIQILHWLEKNGGLVRDIANAHNYLSVLYIKIGDYHQAETHAQRAIDLNDGGTTPKDCASIATYSMVMAQTLYLLGRREEAILHAESALRDWTTAFPPSDFLKARQDELASMKAGTWINPFI